MSMWRNRNRALEGMNGTEHGLGGLPRLFRNERCDDVSAFLPVVTLFGHPSQQKMLYYRKMSLPHVILCVIGVVIFCVFVRLAPLPWIFIAALVASLILFAFQWISHKLVHKLSAVSSYFSSVASSSYRQPTPFLPTASSAYNERVEPVGDEEDLMEHLSLTPPQLLPEGVTIEPMVASIIPALSATADSERIFRSEERGERERVNAASGGGGGGERARALVPFEEEIHRGSGERTEENRLGEGARRGGSEDEQELQGREGSMRRRGIDHYISHTNDDISHDRMRIDNAGNSSQSSNSLVASLSHSTPTLSTPASAASSLIASQFLPSVANLVRLPASPNRMNGNSLTQTQARRVSNESRSRNRHSRGSDVINTHPMGTNSLYRNNPTNALMNNNASSHSNTSSRFNASIPNNALNDDASNLHRRLQHSGEAFLSLRSDETDDDSSIETQLLIDLLCRFTSDIGATSIFPRINSRPLAFSRQLGNVPSLNSSRDLSNILGNSSNADNASNEVSVERLFTGLDQLNRLPGSQILFRNNAYRALRNVEDQISFLDQALAELDQAERDGPPMRWGGRGGGDGRSREESTLRSVGVTPFFDDFFLSPLAPPFSTPNGLSDTDVLSLPTHTFTGGDVEGGEAAKEEEEEAVYTGAGLGSKSGFLSETPSPSPSFASPPPPPPPPTHLMSPSAASLSTSEQASSPSATLSPPPSSHFCSICLEEPKHGQTMTTLPCCHIFHKACIEPWLRRKGRASTCPLCKTPVFG